MQSAVFSSMVQVLRPRQARSGILFDVVAALAGSLLIAACAQCSMTLWFTPVPITAQTFAVLLTGMLLGPRRGGAAAIAYLAEGACGLPVFAGGAAGPMALAGPTGGYLVGFIIAATVVGWLAERGWDRRFVTTALAMAAGEALILGSGALWLATWIGPAGALAQGVLPFLPGAAIKIGLAAALLPLGWKLLGASRAGPMR